MGAEIGAWSRDVDASPWKKHAKLDFRVFSEKNYLNDYINTWKIRERRIWLNLGPHCQVKSFYSTRAPNSTD